MSRWIAVDWLDPAPRVWIVDGGDAAPVAAVADASGANPEARLSTLIGRHLDGTVPVVCCGSAGGWNSAPPHPVPAKPMGQGTPVRTRDARISLSFLPGLSQADPPDLMQGEETRIAGFLAAHPDWDGVLCLPGLRTVWAHISAGEVVSFRSFLTGEIAQLLTDHSTLGAVLQTPAVWADDAFLAALGDAMSRPERVAGALSSMRVAPQDAGARLWGNLIGQELAATRAYWLGQRVALIGDPQVTARYATALGAQGVDAQTEDGSAMALGGLIAAHARTAP